MNKGLLTFEEAKAIIKSADSCTKEFSPAGIYVRWWKKRICVACGYLEEKSGTVTVIKRRDKGKKTLLYTSFSDLEACLLFATL